MSEATRPFTKAEMDAMRRATRDEEGVPRYLGIIYDITSRKKAEEQVRFQAQLLDSVHQAVIASDLAGTVIYWNRFAETLYGWTADEALGRHVLERYHQVCNVELHSQPSISAA